MTTISHRTSWTHEVDHMTLVKPSNSEKTTFTASGYTRFKGWGIPSLQAGMSGRGGIRGIPSLQNLGYPRFQGGIPGFQGGVSPVYKLYKRSVLFKIKSPPLVENRPKQGGGFLFFDPLYNENST